jgi:ABC-type dipeptide/oligopeptide/nickel transport system permease subunit
MGQGGQGYILYGLLTCCISIMGGLFLATATEWSVRQKLPMPFETSKLNRTINITGLTLIELVDSIPKFLLLLSIYAISGLTTLKLAIAMGIFMIFGVAAIFRELFASFLSSEQYIYALEIGMSQWRIYLNHIIKRNLGAILMIQIPFVLSSFILYESTLTYFNINNPGLSSWGLLIRSNLAKNAEYAFRIPMISILLVVSSLYVMGDAMRELNDHRHQ